MDLIADKRARMQTYPETAAEQPVSGAGARTMPAAKAIGFDAFEQDIWNGIAPERRTPMQQHIWARAAAETISPDHRVMVVTVGSEKAPQAFAPLTRSSSWPTRLLLLGAEEINESVEVAYQNEDALTELARGMVRTGLPIGFGHYLADSPLIGALRRAYRGRGVVVAKALPKRGCPSIVLDRSWMEPETHFNARRQSDLRRMQRAAAKLGKVTTEILSPTPSTLGGLLDEAMAVEAEGWKGRSGTALARDERLGRFFRRYTELATEAGILRLCFLRIDGRSAAMQLAVETENRFWLLKIGYDETYKRCSPGNLLMRETIRYAADRGLVSYEFLGKEAAWTQVWTETARPLVALRTYPANLAGLAAVVADVTHAAGQKLAGSIAARRQSSLQKASIKEARNA